MESSIDRTSRLLLSRCLKVSEMMTAVPYCIAMELTIRIGNLDPWYYSSGSDICGQFSKSSSMYTVFCNIEIKFLVFAIFSCMNFSRELQEGTKPTVDFPYYHRRNSSIRPSVLLSVVL